MSTTTFQPPAITNGHDHSAEDVRIYRGRNMAEVIPQIRDELGADALILREREGLIGGVNGFFARRFIEVHARPNAQRIDIYDDDELPEPDQAVAEPDPVAAPDPVPAPAPEPAADTTPEPAPPPWPDGLESFAAQLASAEAEVLAEAEAELARRAAARARPVASEPEVAPEPAAPLKPVQAPKPAAAPEPPVIGRPPAAPEPRPAASAPAPPPTPAPAPPRALATPPKTRSARKPSRPWSRSPKRAKPPGPDQREVAAIVGELIDRGMSEQLALRLIAKTLAHGNPLASASGLRDAVRTTLAHSLPRAPILPSGGAAIAFVGSGGAGKTRCVAALATAYHRASTLPVSAVSLAALDHGHSLIELIGPGRVPNRIATSSAAAGRHVEATRKGGMAILDTPAITPANPGAVRALANELDPLSLDAVYVAVPATLGAQPASQLLGALAPLCPSGIVITHADETDQLGVAIELACVNGIPVSYIHEGLELARSMSAPDPLEVARRLLP
jgi:flagellar biosynthesis GTPase FlhF